LHPSPTLSAQDRDLLRSRLQALTPTVFESSLPAQAIHGDASMSNLLRTNDGLIWNDLEDVCAGPVHWDVAGLVVVARARGESEAFVADFLRAYGGPELEELDDFIAAHRLYTTVWRAFDAQRRWQTQDSADVSVSGESAGGSRASAH
jgi:Ser/Thr protein kinase RdoA (MazF antagonist)